MNNIQIIEYNQDQFLNHVDELQLIIDDVLYLVTNLDIEIFHHIERLSSLMESFLNKYENILPDNEEIKRKYEDIKTMHIYFDIKINEILLSREDNLHESQLA